MITGIAPGLSDISLELIAANGGVGIDVMAEVCRIVLYGFGMSVEWAVGIVVQIFMGRVISGTVAAMELYGFLSME